MSLIGTVMGQAQKEKQAPLDMAIDFLTGGVVGVLVNDIWEIAKLPGYFQPAFNAGNVTVGYDDLAQGVLIPSAVGIVGTTARVRGTVPFALGLAAAVPATKLVEAHGGPIRLQIIPHQIEAPAQSNMVNDTENQLRLQSRAYGAAVNDTQNQLRLPSRASSVRFSM